MVVSSVEELLTSNEEYKCTLSPEVQKVALNELREDENIRSQSIKQMREWIEKHPAIKRCRTDPCFLLRFLRTKKFSVPQACEMLERYLTIRQLFPHWFSKLDIENKELEEIIDNGYLFPLPQKDELGRQIIMSCAGRFDPYKYTSSQMAKIHSIVAEYLMDDEDNQINGYVHINDEGGISMGHISLWSLRDVRNMVVCVQNSAPMRLKSTHFINIPTYASKFFEFATSLLSEKLKSRIIIHKSLDDLKEKINPKLLPKEYGGESELKTIIDDFKKKLHANRDKLLLLDDMYIEIDHKKCSLVDQMNEELGLGLDGSFKKLTVD